VRVYVGAPTHALSILLARTFRGWLSLVSEIFQTCSQLIHTRLVVVLASGLETRNQLQKRQEKNEFYFQLWRKNFLDGENEARLSLRKQEMAYLKNFVSQSRLILRRRNERFAADRLRTRVDRIDLCAQFLASASGA
jgi:hypothetical protein